MATKPNLFDKDGANYNPPSGHRSGHGKVNVDHAGSAKQAFSLFSKGLNNNESAAKKKKSDAQKAAIQNLINKHGSGK